MMGKSEKYAGLIVLVSILAYTFSIREVGAFCTRYHQVSVYRDAVCQASPSKLRLSKGDPLRDATGIRPSLHPTTINAISDALRYRARKKKGMNFRVSETVQPLDVALTAGEIAAEAVHKRQETSDQDGMKLTPDEERTIAGRIIGVIMRFDDLETQLHDKVASTNWVPKYNEWSSFGVIESEDDFEFVDDRIKVDPLFAVTRAECLLALFLSKVEIPQLEKIGESVSDESKIDFLDSDRLEVLLSDN